MKSIIILFVLLSLKGIAQDWEPTQADSVYMVNHVKSRTMRFGNQEGSRIVNNYDYNGRLMKRTQFDNKGKQYYNKGQLTYDKEGKLVTTTYYTYWHEANNTIVLDSVANKGSINTVSFNYDEMSRLVGKTVKNSSGKMIYEGSYTYNPLTLVSKFSSPTMEDHYTSSTIVYEAPNVEKKDSGDFGTALVLKSNWDYRYENTFDENARIIKRIKTSLGLPGWAMELLYEYDANGLLVKFTSGRADCTKSDCASVVTFTYEYWDNHFIAKQ